MKSSVKSLIDRKVGTRIARMLHDSQHEHGYLLESEIRRIAEQVGEPLNVVQDVIGFFPHYRQTPPPVCDIHLCRDMTCRLRGSVEASAKLRRWKQERDAMAPNRSSTIEFHESSCLGRCDRAPAALINDRLYVGRSTEELVSIAEASYRGEIISADSDRSTADEALARSEIDCYRKNPPIEGAYSAVRRFLRAPVPERILTALETAGLVGMGGAGAPTWRKWSDARQAKSATKYIVCNADESEPGTFKDRDLLSAAPHLIIEGMIMAALIVEAHQGFIYIRHEYLEQAEGLRQAIAAAEKIGACGASVFDSGQPFHIEVFTSPGGYVCGEQTALIEALEGKRSEPRNRPPELETNGLYDQPTVLNNVETLAWVPAILLAEPTAEQIEKERLEIEKREQEKSKKQEANSSQPTPKLTSTTSDVPREGLWYKFAGRKRIRGKRFFSISGDVAKPGAYEVPCGITLGELIDDYAGGLRDGEILQAVALSGPSGGFLPAQLPKGTLRTPRKSDSEGKPTEEWKYPELVGERIDVRLLPLDIPISRELNYLLGAGIVIYGGHANMLEQAVACSRFFQRESCGKCVPCRLGSRKIADLAEQLLLDHASRKYSDIRASVKYVGELMTATGVCICALGASASNPLATYLRYFDPSASNQKRTGST